MEMKLAGDFLTQPTSVGIDNSYPVSNTSWYPRHGYLDRSTFTLKFKHSKQWKVAAIGTRLSENPSETEKNMIVTVYEMKHPVPFATFALGDFERHTEMIKWESGAPPTPLEFNSMSNLKIEEPLMMAEMNNSVRYFAKLFGPYPYETYGAAFHPYGFGQGLPSLLLIPSTNHDSAGTFSFISHETAHQWWGNTVAWRSYRDQWLSEGFAEYSGVLYTNLRKNRDAGKKLVDELRMSLREPNLGSLGGQGKGKLADLGPIILGHRLASKRSVFGYQTLIYNKGGLVLRMLHFLFTDPATGDGQPFFDMMKAFTERYRERTASTEDFQRIANEYFLQTAIARQHGLSDLNWFFREWVYEADLPSFQLKYQVDTENGSTFLTGTIMQEGVANNWTNILPIVMKFGGKQAVGTVIANGPSTPFRIKIPARPEKVELDPDRWVISDKTVTQ
jgi:aminopeptidase N